MPTQAVARDPAHLCEEQQVWQSLRRVNVIDDSKNPGYLFVISVMSGSLDVDTLTGVPTVIYFSDRPDRVAGHLSLEKFVESWNKGV